MLTHPTIPPSGHTLLANLIYQDLQPLCIPEELSRQQVEAAAAILLRLVPSSQGFEATVGNIMSSLSPGCDSDVIRTVTNQVIGKLMSVGSQPR